MPLVEITVCSGSGATLVSLIIKTSPIITARFVVPLTLTMSQSFRGTAMNFAEWSVVPFKMAFPLALTTYKMFSSVLWPRMEIIPWCMAKKMKKKTTENKVWGFKGKLKKESQKRLNSTQNSFFLNVMAWAVKPKKLTFFAEVIEENCLLIKITITITITIMMMMMMKMMMMMMMMMIMILIMIRNNNHKHNLNNGTKRIQEETWQRG